LGKRILGEGFCSAQFRKKAHSLLREGKGKETPSAEERKNLTHRNPTFGLRGLERGGVPVGGRESFCTSKKQLWVTQLVVLMGGGVMRVIVSEGREGRLKERVSPVGKGGKEIYK